MGPRLWRSAERLTDGMLQAGELNGDIPGKINPNGKMMALFQGFKFAQSQRAIEFSERIRSARNRNVEGRIGGTHKVLPVRLACATRIAVMMEGMRSIHHEHGDFKFFREFSPDGVEGRLFDLGRLWKK